MAPKKKGKKKGDKLAQMSVEQRRVYLDRKAAQEQEHGRRREELLAGFLKLKLSDEEAKNVVNNSKLTLKWREILRETKCRSLKIQLEEIWKGVQESADQQGRLTDILQKQVAEARQQRTVAAQNNLLTVQKLMALHEEHVEMLTHHLRARQSALMVNVAQGIQSQVQSHVANLRRVDLVMSAALDEQAEIEREELASYHTSITNITAKLEEELAASVADQELALEDAWLHLASVAKDHEHQTTALRNECAWYQKKVTINQNTLKRLTQTIKETQTDIVTWKACLKKGTILNEMNVSQRTRLGLSLKFLRRSLVDAKDESKYDIIKTNKRADGIIENLQKLINVGKTVLDLDTVCRRLETPKDSNLPFLPQPSVVHFAAPEPDRVPSLEMDEEESNQTTIKDSGVGSSIATTTNDSAATNSLSQKMRNLNTSSTISESPPNGEEMDDIKENDKINSEVLQETVEVRSAMTIAKEEPILRVWKLLENEEIAKEAASVSKSSNAAQLSDFILQEADTLLNIQEALRKFYRKCQQVELERMALRKEEDELKHRNEALCGELKTHLLSLGLSDKALNMEDTPFSVETLKIHASEVIKRKVETDISAELFNFTDDQTLNKAPRQEDEPLVQEANIIQRQISLHFARRQIKS